jgi:hypothetical protein
MRSDSPVAFVLQHTDNCPRCSACDFCPTGIALMKTAVEVLSDLHEPPAALPPIPDIPRSKFKA